MAGRSARTAVSALAVLGLAALGAAPASANTVLTNTASTVTCVYTFTAWSGGFSANIQIINNGPAAIDGWTLRWTFAVPTAVTSGWSATITDTDGHDVSATNAIYNGVIGSGQSTAFGWSAQAVSTSAPTDLTVNGMPC
jgi:hypothetical protein